MHTDISDAIELISRNNIWNTWVQATRKGNTAIGKTFEDVLGIVENNYCSSDLKGVEIKSKRSDSDALVTLFTKNPTTPYRAVHKLLADFGYPDKTDDPTLRFNTNFCVGRNTSFREHTITLELRGEDVHVVADGQSCAMWARATLETVLVRKLPALALLDADTKHVDEIEMFLLKACDIYWSVSYASFISLVADGSISVHFRVTARPSGNGVKNRGCAFRINSGGLAKLYSEGVSVKPKDIEKVS